METPEEHYVEDTMGLSKEAKKYEEKGRKPETTEEYKERIRKFNEELIEKIRNFNEELMSGKTPQASKKAAASEKATA